MIYGKYVALLSLLLLTNTSFSQNPNIQTAYLACFKRPARLNKGGLLSFFKCYNHPLYTKFLPRSFHHVGQLLSYMKFRDDPYTYALSIISLFHDRFKACKWSNYVAVAQLLDKLLVNLDMLSFQDNKELLLLSLEEKLEQFKNQILEHRNQTTNNSISARSMTEILYTDCIDSYLQDQQKKAALKTIIVRFLESILDKLIWDHHDGVSLWKVFQIIGDQLEQLRKRNIIDDDDTLNHLVRSLVVSFDNFINEWGSRLPVELYITMMQDLNAGNLPFLHHEEQEPYMLTKAQALRQALKLGFAKAQMVSQGFISEPINSTSNYTTKKTIRV